jgi:hypothetical protein
MCHSFLLDASFYWLLLHLDEQIAREVQAKGCPYCGGRLHRANYARKPRGVPRSVLGAGYTSRLSFCCAEEGCRRRTTPASVRFLGRRVYLGVVVALMSALSRGGRRGCVHYLNQHLGISGRTLQRWRQWWCHEFVHSRFWQVARARLSPPVRESALPNSVLERFSGGRLSRRLIRLLDWLSPITTGAAAVAPR